MSSSTPVDHTIPTRDGWYWQTDDGRWHLFEQPSSKTLEDSRQNNPQSSVQFARGKQSYVIDLKAMVQTNTATGKQRSVVRVGTGIVSVKSPATHLWFWKSRKHRWHSFHADDSDTIEKQFTADPNATFRLSCNYRIYSIDLKNNTQTNVETNDQCMLKRIPSVTQLAINRAIGKTFIWQWENDNNIWETFDANYGIVSSEAIETAFLADNNAKIAFHFNRLSYFIELEGMKQVNESSGKERNIRRIKFSTDDSRGIFPITWTNITAAADLQLISISSTGPTAKEHLAVVELFAKTMPNYWLTSVKRIQNRLLYQRFHLYKTQLEERMGTGNGVRRLFHGTSKKNIDAICQQGFDFRLKSTYAYGQGSYFARDAQYSFSYSGDCSTMFVAQVLVGEYTVGNSSMVRPPSKNKRGELYDSVVDNVINPSIFVVFDIAHSYPEYLIEYSNQPQPAAARVPAPSPLAVAPMSPPAAPQSQPAAVPIPSPVSVAPLAPESQPVAPMPPATPVKTSVCALC